MTKLEHLRRHEHVLDVYGALRASTWNHPGLFLSALRPQSPSFPAPSPLISAPSLLITCPAPRIASYALARSHPVPFFDSVERGGVFNQLVSFDTSSVTDMSDMFSVRSAARALPPALQSGPPRARATCARRCPTPSSLSRPASNPAPCALLSTRQYTTSLSAANRLLIRCAWAGNSAFTTAGSTWGTWGDLRSCPP